MALGATSEPLRAAIFDMDGVVTRTARLHQAAWKQLFDDFLARRSERAAEDRRPFVEEDYRAHVDGKPRYDGIRDFLVSRGITLPEGGPEDPPDVDTVRSLGLRKNLMFRDLVARRGMEVDEAAVRLARSLRGAGVRVGVATSSENGALILGKAALTALFDAHVDGVDSRELGLQGKPHPDLFRECARRLRSAPANTIVIEDAASGVTAARSGGFGLVIGVDRRDNWLRLREAGADWIVRDLDELSWERVAQYWAARAEARPNLLREWPAVAQMLRGRRMVLFLDYDGTLTPIVDRPELAVLDAATRQTLESLTRAWPTYIISGRGLEDVQRLVGIETLWYAGSHGYDIAAPRGTAGSRQVAPELEPEIHRAADELREATRSMSGVLIEDKRFSIAVHYRLAEEERVPDLESFVDRVTARHSALKKGHGKKVFQIRPAMDWEKGKALLWLLEATDHEDAFPVYIGDDSTDEDAFAVLVERGLGVLVTDLPRPTAARYALQDPFEVRLFLERLRQTASEARR